MHAHRREPGMDRLHARCPTGRRGVRRSWRRSCILTGKIARPAARRGWKARKRAWRPSPDITTGSQHCAMRRMATLSSGCSAACSAHPRYVQSALAWKFTAVVISCASSRMSNARPASESCCSGSSIASGRNRSSAASIGIRQRRRSAKPRPADAASVGSARIRGECALERCSDRRFLGGRRRCSEREGEREPRPAGRAVCRPYPAPMRVDDGAADRKSQSNAWCR